MAYKKTKFSLLIMLLYAVYNSANAFEVLQALPETPIIPKSNPQTEAKIALGKQLYFDTRLSKDMNYSCNSCHNLAAGGDDDGAATRLKDRDINRSAPSIYNAAYQTVQYWDGHARSLEFQAMEHILSANYMAMRSEKVLLDRFSQIPGYVEAFESSFDGGLNLMNMARALSSFVRTLKTPDSDFDNYIRGNETALNESAKRGLHLFNEVGCMACHFGVNFAGPAPGPAFGMGDGFYELFPNYLGSKYDRKYKLTKDTGRDLITKDRGHKYMWRVPPLRNIADTAPYFHNGSVYELDEAVRVMARTQLKKTLSDEDVSDLVAFLNSLTGKYPQISLPRLPETPGVSLTNQRFQLGE